MSDTKYTKDHEWIRIEGDEGVIGITDYAQEQLGDVVHVDLPEVGASLSKGDEAAVIDSVKAASEVYSPVDGEVTAVNEALEEDPGKVNSDAEGDGWFLRLKLSDKGQLDGLMDKAAYDDFVAGQ
jgi:glycine cleavage system H protein